MGKNKRLLFLAVALVLVLAVGGVAYNLLVANTAPDVEVEGSTVGSVEAPSGPVEAPDFTVQDWEGNEVSLSDLTGKPVVLNFWASWCGPCQIEMPEFQTAYEEYGDEVNFVLVDLTNSRESVEDGKAFIEENGYTFPVYFDVSGEAASAYGIRSIPSTYFVREDGYTLKQVIGSIDGASLDSYVNMLI